METRLVHPISKYKKDYVLQQKLPKDCVPHLMHIKGDMDIISLRPSLPMVFPSPYSIWRRDEDLTIKGWRKVNE